MPLHTSPIIGRRKNSFETLRHALERTAANKFIVDVRHNNGGNNGLLRPLIRTLVGWEADEPGRRIFVIMGRNTFSAAQNFLKDDAEELRAP